MVLPLIIQGGMGAGVSNWLLARAVAETGQLGVVSGTAIDTIMIRRLQMGDIGGHIRRALEHFPVPEIVQRILKRFYIPGGKSKSSFFRRLPLYSYRPGSLLQEITVVANFVEVFLAKEKHQGLIGINFLEKIQMPILASIYGAMLAGVNYILMGAGIPWQIPRVLEELAQHQKTSMKVQVDQANSTDDFQITFDPNAVMKQKLPNIDKPKFLAIVSSATLAIALLDKTNGKIDGFIVENYLAGGHNAPPRGKLQLDESGEPKYGPKDQVDLSKMRSIDRPFWLAGTFNSPESLKEALIAGASGIQAGTIFAFAKESGLAEELKHECLTLALQGKLKIFTDPKASPTGFPFKVALLDNSISSEAIYKARERGCDLGYLRQMYKRSDNSIGYRCPAEHIDDYVKKGGNADDTNGRKCLCNALLANIGLAQIQPNGFLEDPLVTLGNDVSFVPQLVTMENPSYSVKDAVTYLLRQTQ